MRTEIKTGQVVNNGFLYCFDTFKGLNRVRDEQLFGFAVLIYMYTSVAYSAQIAFVTVQTRLLIEDDDDTELTCTMSCGSIKSPCLNSDLLVIRPYANSTRLVIRPLFIFLITAK